MSDAENHDNHAPTTRVTSPIRDIVRNAVVAGFSQCGTHRAIRNHYEVLFHVHKHTID